MKYIALILVFMVFGSAQAQNFPALPEEDMQTIIENKQFVGGVDSEDLKVQKDVRAPYRNLNIRKVRKEVYEEVLKEANEATESAEPSPVKKENI